LDDRREAPPPNRPQHGNEVCGFVHTAGSVPFRVRGFVGDRSP
jgi:hypothetical protein